MGLLAAARKGRRPLFFDRLPSKASLAAHGACARNEGQGRPSVPRETVGPRHASHDGAVCCRHAKANLAGAKRRANGRGGTQCGAGKKPRPCRWRLNGPGAIACAA